MVGFRPALLACFSYTKAPSTKPQPAPAAPPPKKNQGPLSQVLDQTQLVYDVSGAGNNWAHGHHGYGPQYRDALSEQLRRAAEACDSLQSFLLLHSLGGGTGSGLGTYILGMLQVRAAATDGRGASWRLDISV